MNSTKTKKGEWMATESGEYEEVDNSQDDNDDEDYDVGEDDGDYDDDSDDNVEGFDELESRNNADYDKDTSFEDEISATNASLMKEIVEVLESKSDINCFNALALNKEMQKKLLNVRDTMVHLLERIKNRLTSNEKSLLLAKKYKQKGVGIRGAYLKGGTFYFKGNMFFKDINCRSCPNNQDYIHRSEIEREMFPMDFELRGRHVWSMTDKYQIVHGIKEQVIDHLSPITSKSTKRSDQLDKKISLHTKKLANLLEKVDDSFEIDWKLISIYNLKHRHSPSSSNAMWNVYLKPDLKRGAWTNEENKKLVDAAKRHNFEDWNSIAAELKFRSDYQCFVHFQTKLHKLIKRESKWTAAEDKRLLEIVNVCTANGVINWNAVSARFPNRTKARCCIRYYYRVNPILSHAPFSPEEDLMLLAAVEEYGENFSCMPRTLFPNRSTLQLRNRYKNTLCHRDKNNGWTHEENKKLMEFVAEHGESSWKKCAETIGTHTRTSCRGRFITITRFLKKNPNATLEDLVSRPRAKDNCISSTNWAEKIIELRNNPDAWKSKSKCKRKLLAETRKNEKKLEKPKMPKVRYIKKLRSTEMELYHFFKYAYNFKLQSDPCRTTFYRPFSLAVVQNACGFEISSHQSFITDETLPHNVGISYSNMLEIASSQHGLHQHMSDLWGYRLPPNWSTLMGFRALCVQSNQATQVKTETEDSTVIENSQAVQLFRQRLRVILYTTALLSRLNPQNVINLKKRIESQQMQEPMSQTGIDSMTMGSYEQEFTNLSMDTSVSSSYTQIGMDSIIIESQRPFKQEHTNVCKDIGASLSHTKIGMDPIVMESYEPYEQEHTNLSVETIVPSSQPRIGFGPIALESYEPCKQEHTNLYSDTSVSFNHKQIGMDSIGMQSFELNEQEHTNHSMGTSVSSYNIQTAMNSIVMESYELCKEEHTNLSMDSSASSTHTRTGIDPIIMKSDDSSKHEHTNICKNTGVQSNELRKEIKKRIVEKLVLRNKKPKSKKIQEIKEEQNCLSANSLQIKIELE